MPALIDCAVGRHGHNLPADVTTVQWLLNYSMPIPLRDLEVNGVVSPPMIEAIERYQREVVRLARATGTIAPGDATLASLSRHYLATVAVKPRKVGGKYTKSPNEVGAEATRLGLREIVDALVAAWPEIGEQGARTLTAQYWGETGRGSFCWNWNLGNVKQRSTAVRHVYLPAWECLSQTAADAYIAAGKGLVRLATEDEIKKKGWKCDSVTTFFTPPHEETRFAAYASLQEGAEAWLRLHRRIHDSNAKYLPALQAGDTAGAAAALKQAHYYTASEKLYAATMAAMKKEIDAKLGPVPAA